MAVNYGLMIMALEFLIANFISEITSVARGFCDSIRQIDGKDDQKKNGAEQTMNDEKTKKFVFFFSSSKNSLLCIYFAVRAIKDCKRAHSPFK